MKNGKWFLLGVALGLGVIVANTLGLLAPLRRRSSEEE